MPWVLLYSSGSLERSGEDADVRLAFPLWSVGSNSPLIHQLTKAGPWGCRSVFEALVGPLFYLLYFTCFKDAFALVLCNS